MYFRKFDNVFEVLHIFESNRLGCCYFAGAKPNPSMLHMPVSKSSFMPTFGLKILDRYILGNFLRTYLFVVFVFTTIIIVIDLTEKNDDFIKTKPGWEKIIFEYVLNLVPYFANLLSPIMVFIATVLVTSRLAARTEIVAILASGVSFKRLLWPYFLGSSLIGLSIFYLIAWAIPNSNKQRVAFELVYLKNPFFFEGRNVHLKVAPETFAYLESYNNANQTGYLFSLETIKGTDLISKLSADRMVWQPDRGTWQLENYKMMQFFEDNQTVRSGAKLDTLIPNLTPKDFESNYLHNETLTSVELEEYIQRLKSRGAENVEPYLVEKYLRYSYPFAIIILTLMGVILSARKSREGPGFQIALGFLLAFIYIVFYIISRSIAEAGSMPPMLACWLPNIVFGIIGLILYKTVPR